jgi:hypothetical protein
MTDEIQYSNDIFEFINDNPIYNIKVEAEFTIENNWCQQMSLHHVIDDDNVIQYTAEFKKDTDDVVTSVLVNGNKVKEGTTTRTAVRPNLEILKEFVLDKVQEFVEEKYEEAKKAVDAGK